MKTLIHNKKIVLLVLLITVFTACNKDNISGEGAIHIIVNGYNGTAADLEISIDSTVYDGKSMNGKFIQKAASIFTFNAVYTYPLGHTPAVLNIKDPKSDKVFYSKKLPETGTKATFNFIYNNGKELVIETPAAAPTTNKLGFYINGTQNNKLVDIFLYQMNDSTGIEHRVYLAKNVMPNRWIYIDYIAAKEFDDKNKLGKSSLCFTKAGTIDQWAFGEETLSKESASSLNIPLAGELGLVQPYFVISGATKLEIARLYFYPDRVR